MIEVTREIGARWKNISESDKSVYEGMAKEEKKRYETQMNQYKENGEFIAVAKPTSGLVVASSSSSQSQSQTTMKTDPEGEVESTPIESTEPTESTPSDEKIEPVVESEVVKMEE